MMGLIKESVEEAAFGGTIDKMQHIVDTKSAMEINGVMVDTFTASLIMDIFSKVNKDNQDKMRKMPVEKLASAAYKLANRSKEAVEEVVDETVEAVEEGSLNKDGSYQTSDDEANEFDDEDDDSEEIATETVEVPVNELAELMQLAGYTDYAEKIEEYANEPEENYMDAEEQLIGLSGGLNGPKKMYAAAAGGDNPMDQEPREVTESTFESFYKKYDKFVAELTESEQDK